MARGATRGQRQNRVGNSFGGNSSLARRLGIEPLEERSMLSVNVTNTGIEAGEGLKVDGVELKDTIPRLSGFNLHSPNYEEIDNRLERTVYKAQLSDGDWSNPATWLIKDATHNNTQATTAPAERRLRSDSGGKDRQIQRRGGRRKKHLQSRNFGNADL